MSRPSSADYTASPLLVLTATQQAAEPSREEKLQALRGRSVTFATLASSASFTLSVQYTLTVNLALYLWEARMLSTGAESGINQPRGFLSGRIFNSQYTELLPALFREGTFIAHSSLL